MTDIKDIQRAMDNMPLGDGSAFAEISVGPAKHEQFLNAHFGKVLIGLIVFILLVAGWIVYSGMQNTMQRKAAAALIAATPQNPATGAITLEPQALQQVQTNFADSRAAVTANYLHAMALWQTGQEQTGTQAMQTFIDSAPSEEWKAQAQITLACHFMSQGLAEQAKPLFQAVIDAQNPTFAPVATLCLGDIARAAGNMDAAGNLYRSLSEQYAESAVTLNYFGYPLRKMLFGITPPTPIESQEK